MKNKINSCIVVSFLLFSCDKEAKVKLPETENEPVVIGFLTPEKTKTGINLWWTDPLYSDNTLDGGMISNATVSLSDGTSSVNLPYDAVDEYYWVDTSVFVVSPGNTYTVTVILPDGKQATASTLIPVNYVSTLTLFQQDLTYSDSSATFWNVQASGDIEWTDIPSEANYYALAYYTLLKAPFTGDTIEQFHFQTLLNDAGRDGLPIRNSFTTSYSYNQGNYTPIGTRVVVATVNRDYYEYHRTAELGIYSDPFAEPVLIYSNVTGGVGALCGYRQKVFDIFY